MTPGLLDVLVAEITMADGEQLDRLAETLVPLLDRITVRRVAPPPPGAWTADGWLTARQAAEYVGLTLHALHKHTAARTIPFEQDGPRCKLWFRRSELDAWRRREAPAQTALGRRMLPNRFQVAEPRLPGDGRRTKKNPA